MTSSDKTAVLQGEDLMDLIRDRVAMGQVVRYLPFRGRSMLPMLRQGKDLIELSPICGKLKKYDLPVYRYPSGKYVMHRVIEVKDDYYICNGDNLLEMEQIPHEWMIAVVSAFTRNGRRIEVTNKGYRAYCRFWCFTMPLRHLIRRTVENSRRKLVRLLKHHD